MRSDASDPFSIRQTRIEIGREENDVTDHDLRKVE
jgi:hypothetical protein